MTSGRVMRKTDICMGTMSKEGHRRISIRTYTSALNTITETATTYHLGLAYSDEHQIPSSLAP